MRRTRWTATLAVALLFVVLPALTGCGRKAEEERAEAVAEGVLSQATGKHVEIDANGKQVHIEGEGLSATIAETDQWPADMFAGVPEFEAGKIERVSRSEGEGARTYNIFVREIESGGVERYVALLKEGGWTVNHVSMGAQGSLINAQKGGLGLTLAYSQEKQEGTLAVFSSAE